MPTATAQPDQLSDLDPQAELEAARREHAALLERIDSDEAITPLQLAESEASVRLAEERIALLERRAAAAAEERRLATIAKVTKDLNGGRVRAEAKAIVDAYDAAVAALVSLRERADVYDASITAAWRELRGCEPLPEELHRDERNHRVTVDGVMHAANTKRSHALLGRAAIDAAARGSASLVRDGAISAHNPIDRIRRAAGN